MSDVFAGDRKDSFLFVFSQLCITVRSKVRCVDFTPAMHLKYIKSPCWIGIIILIFQYYKSIWVSSIFLSYFYNMSCIKMNKQEWALSSKYVLVLNTWHWVRHIYRMPLSVLLTLAPLTLNEKENSPIARKISWFSLNVSSQPQMFRSALVNTKLV